MTPDNLRFSVTITLDEKLRKAKRNTHDLCCAWGCMQDKSTDLLFNVVGWSSDDITEINEIAWTEKYLVSASKNGPVPGFTVKQAFSPIDIDTNREFIVKDFDSTTFAAVKDADYDKTNFGFEVRVGCSVLLYRALDLDRSEDNMTPIFVASDNGQNFTPPGQGRIYPVRSLLIFFAPKGHAMIRRKAFDIKKLSNPPIIYNYGNEPVRFTGITITYDENGPHMKPEIKHSHGESRMRSIRHELLDEPPVVRLLE